MAKSTIKKSKYQISENGLEKQEKGKRLPVLKTYKIYVGGQFPRTESGRYYMATNKAGKHLAHVCLSSRKDFRDAVTAARSAWGGWSQRAAYNRGQILYRIAEMLETRKVQFIEELVQQDQTRVKAQQEVELSIDRLIYYAGWCDKYQQLFSTVNPVSSPHFNFSVPEPMGVVAILAPQDSGLLGLVSMMAPVIAGGNTCIILASYPKPLSAVTFGEVLHSSDLPAGVVNILTGDPAELAPQAVSHMDVNAATFSGDDASMKKLFGEKSALNLKRIFHYEQVNWYGSPGQSPYFILDLQEIKTTWHPVENTGGGKAGY